MDSFDAHDVPTFEKNNLTPIGEYPDRYIIEFHDILTDYFGYIFQEPIVKRDGENISEVEFNIIDRQGNINEEEIVKLQVLIANNCKFEKYLGIKEYSIKLKEFLEDIKDELTQEISNPNSRQAFNIIESFDHAWLDPGNILLVNGYPFLKYWGIITRYLPKPVKRGKHKSGFFKKFDIRGKMNKNIIFIKPN